MPLVVCSFDNPRGKAPWLSPLEGIAFLNTMAKVYGWRVDSALGCYRGQCEHSLVVDGHQLTGTGRDGPHLDVLADLLESCGQETMLHVDARRRATLIYLVDWRRDYLGVWQEVPHDRRHMLDAWTLVDHHLYAAN